MRLYISFLFCFVLVGTNENLNSQSLQETGCFITGQISTIAVSGGAFATCSVTGNPVTCAITSYSITCASDPSCNDVVATLSEGACNYTVSNTGEFIQFTIKTTQENVEELKQTYDQLNTAEGIIWLERYLSQ